MVLDVILNTFIWWMWILKHPFFIFRSSLPRYTEGGSLQKTKLTNPKSNTISSTPSPGPQNTGKHKHLLHKDISLLLKYIKSAKHSLRIELWMLIKLTVSFFTNSSNHLHVINFDHCDLWSFYQGYIWNKSTFSIMNCEVIFYQDDELWIWFFFACIVWFSWFPGSTCFIWKALPGTQ